MAIDLDTDYWDKDVVRSEEPKEYNTLNVGPTHPATHGVFQNVMLMDGEFIVSTEQTIGYIHRAFEKIAERRPFYPVSYTHLRAHETRHDIVCRLLLEKKKKKNINHY